MLQHCQRDIDSYHLVRNHHAVADYAVLKYNETRQKGQESVMRGKSNKKKKLQKEVLLWMRRILTGMELMM